MIGTSLTTTLIVVAVNRKRILFYKMMDFCQTTGTIAYINVIFPHSVNNILSTMNLANISPMLDNLLGKNKNNTNSRLLINAKLK